MNNTKYFTILLILLIVLTVLACSPRSSYPLVPPSPTPMEEQSKRVTESPWEKTLKVALKEGRVTVYASDGGSVRANIVEGFKKKHGIDVEWLTASPSEMQTRLLSERKAGLYLADIIMVGPTTLPYELKDRDIFQPMDNYLLLPEVKDANQWYQNQLPWFDAGHTAIGHSSLIVRLVSVNNQVVKPGDITDFGDLINPKWKGKISLNDPTVRGTGQTNLGMLGEFMVGWDFISKLAQQELFITRDNRLQVDWMAKGRYPIAIAARTEALYEYIKEGVPLDYININRGSYLSNGSAGIALPGNAPHPNVATIYLNWFLSQEGQTVFSKARGYQSMRLDVPTGHLDPNIIRDPKIKYANSSNPEAIILRDEWDRKAKEIFGSLTGR